ncbi:YheC/YheD family protein [Cohnella rhizosphaerae]|uniref:YheC/YheD family protein n=1 Tax=Cohnella rhizosphaerae TaxID=1457232 RepID=A0A9X4KZB1_9BACL|nr:YheC/YheD family protein [Cohnella rhizosphaerae]MDG0813293.1 YheC/YheD family protein [Cohnella rhizosphaerae]
MRKRRGTIMHGNNKMGKYRLMRKDRVAARHLPPTAIASLNAVRDMLRRYAAVYIKPSHGTGGYGIFKLARIKGGYQLRHGTRSRVYPKLEQAYAAFVKARANRIYLVQMGIPLLHYKRRPFDLRIMVQRNPKGNWEATGIVGRLAMPNKIVTNYHNGGQAFARGYAALACRPCGQTRGLQKTARRARAAGQPSFKRLFSSIPRLWHRHRHRPVAEALDHRGQFPSGPIHL